MTRLARKMPGLLVTLYVWAVALFIVAPNVVVVFMSFNRARYLIFPPRAYSLRWYAEAVSRVEWRAAFFNSLWIAAITACVATVIGILSGIALHRGTWRGRDAVASFFLSPLMMPQLLLGIALLFSWVRLRMSGSMLALVLGHILVTFPFVLRLVLAALPGVSRSVEEAAMTLGADHFVTTLKITLPIIRPAVFSGWLFAFILSFDNVMISLFLTSPKVITLPIKILSTIEQLSDPSIAAISSIFMVLSLGLMILIDRLVGLRFSATLADRI